MGIDVKKMNTACRPTDSMGGEILVESQCFIKSDSKELLVKLIDYI